MRIEDNILPEDASLVQAAQILQRESKKIVLVVDPDTCKLIGTLTKHVETNVSAVLEKKRRQQQQKAAAAAQDRDAAASTAAAPTGVPMLYPRKNKTLCNTKPTGESGAKEQHQVE